MKEFSLIHGKLELPAFFPDATYGVVKAVDTVDLNNLNIKGMVTNTFHLMNKVGINKIKKIGGLHNLVGWDHIIITDSGGFQVFSMISENSKHGEIRKDGIIFREENGEKLLFTPEKCIQMQFALGSDIIMCLDYCTHPFDTDEVNELAVDTTIRWAKKCKDEYDKQLKMRKLKKRPLIFGIIQGGNSKHLRKKCADELIKLEFDGYGFGGWPLDNDNQLIDDILEYTASLMPNDKIKYAMGIGRPEEIVRCYKMGYDLFDCVIPTREARHTRLYTFNGNSLDEKFYDYLYILDDKYATDVSKISNCKCHLCSNFNKSYLQHLFKINDTESYRLATIHNLAFYNELMERIKNECSRDN